jgi:hypothetical protein
MIADYFASLQHLSLDTTGQDPESFNQPTSPEGHPLEHLSQDITGQDAESVHAGWGHTWRLILNGNGKSLSHPTMDINSLRHH